MATDYVSTTEAAAELEVSSATITRWVREGYINGVHRSPSRFKKGRIRIPRTEIDRLLDGGPQPEAGAVA